MAQLEPLILSLQGQGKIAGLLSEGPEQRQPQEVRFGDTVLRAVFERGAPPRWRTVSCRGPAGGAAAALRRPGPGRRPGRVIVGGTAVTVTFTSSQAGRRIGILSAEEGRFVAGKSENVRWLSDRPTRAGTSGWSRAGSPPSSA